METLYHIESSIASLSIEDYTKFIDWFCECENQKWDTKLDADIVSSKINAFANAALREFKDGKYSTL